MKDCKDLRSGFSFFTLDKGGVKEMPEQGNSFFCFVFLLEGQGVILSKTGHPLALSAKECTILPVTDTLYLQAKEDLKCVILYFLDPVALSAFNSFVSSYGRSEEEKSVLPILLSLWKYLDFTLTVLTEMQKNKEWMELKIYELFQVLRYSYPSSRLAGFLSVVKDRDYTFRQKVRQYMAEADSIPELLNLLGMKRTTFEKHFRREFGTSPYQWILERKAYGVKHSLCHTSLSMDEIRQIHGFNSGSHFVRFCYRKFGMNPSQLRKQYK